MYLSMSKKIMMILIISCFYLGVGKAQVCRVSTSGSLVGTGATWDDTKTLELALFQSNDCREIWLKSGTYYPTTGLNRDISFKIRRGVNLYGGFYGHESSRDQRDPINNKAILSGDIGLNNVATDNTHQVVVIDAGGVPTNPDHVITILDGLVISDGYSEIHDGAGLYCSISQENAGCSPHLINMEFKNNVAVDGGALSVYTGHFSFADILISETRFINNSSLDNGGAVYIRVNYEPNAIIILDAFKVYNSEFINNQAQGVGGAIYISHESNDYQPHLINNSTFVNNQASSGGAIYLDISDSVLKPTRIQNSTFHNNFSSSAGGAIFNSESELIIENSTLTDNTANVAGGGIYINGQYTSMTLNNSILWGNSAPSGNQLHSNETRVIKANYNVIQNDCAGFVITSTLPTSCTNNQTADPKLGLLKYNNGLTQTRLPGSGSSAINNGDNATCLANDQRGFSRPQNVFCDMGSVEVRDACRVTTSGTNNGNGTNWGNQAMSLQTALAVAYCPLVKIKFGTYMPTANSDRSLSFNIPAGVTIQGGYDGTTENENNPDPDTYKVILSGDIGTNGDMTDNSYHVVRLNGHLGTKIQPSTVISDIEIRDGYSSSSFFDYPNNSGAGLYCIGTGLGGECSPSLFNVKFINNHALGGNGGAMFNDGDNEGKSSPQLINVLFENNAAYNGGAMYNNGYNQGQSSPIVINAEFTSNTAINGGGAVYNRALLGQSNGTFISGLFSYNTAKYGGAVHNNGQDLGSSNPTFDQIFFLANTADFDGGAVYSAGWNGGQSKPYFQSVRFHYNSAQRGGAVFLNDLAGNETAEFFKVSFSNNQAVDGGALYNDGENGFSHPKLTNVTIVDNVASNHGGGIYNNGDGGGSSPEITNATIINNSAIYGGAIYSSGDSNGNSHAIMRNVIMWGNTASSDGPTVYHNLAESSTYDSIMQFGCPNYGLGSTICNNIIDADPLLLSIDYNNGHTVTVSPSNNSPAIDAGDDAYCPSEDQRGRPRPNSLACDIGSIEVDYQGPTDIIFKNGFD